MGRWARRGRARRPPPRRAPRICNDRYNSRFEITYNIHNNLVPPTGGTFELAKARIAAVLSTQLAPLCSAPRCQAVTPLAVSPTSRRAHLFFSYSHFFFFFFFFFAAAPNVIATAGAAATTGAAAAFGADSAAKRAACSFVSFFGFIAFASFSALRAAIDAAQSPFTSEFSVDTALLAAAAFA